MKSVELRSTDRSNVAHQLLQLHRAAAERGHGVDTVQDAPNFFLPLPPIAYQRRLVLKLRTLKEKIDEVRRLQSETDAEIAATLPAILADEFRTNT